MLSVRKREIVTDIFISCPLPCLRRSVGCVLGFGQNVSTLQSLCLQNRAHATDLRKQDNINCGCSPCGQ